MRLSSRPVLHRTASAAAIVVVVALVSFGATSSAIADPASPVWVAQSEIQGISATSGWAEDYADISRKGIDAVGTPAGDVSQSLELKLLSANQQITVQKRYAPADFVAASATDNFANLRSMLRDAEYTFTGGIVSYQLNIYYLPVDSDHYGVAGTTKACAAALPPAPTGWCYTTMKYVPATAPTAFTTVDVASTLDVAESTISGQPKRDGWFRSQQIGIYPKAGSPIGDASLNQMLAQISQLQLTSFGVSDGPSLVAEDAWVKDFTFDGTTYRFGTAPVVKAPVAPPVASSDDLAAVFATAGADIAATTDSFVPTSGSDPGAVDPNKPFSGTLPWAAADNFVDVYAYSTPTFIGTYPVINGKLVITNADLSKLEAGGHTLVFIGQDSAVVDGMTLSVVVLAATGVEATPWLLAGAGAILLGGLVFLLRRRTRVAR